MSLIVDSIPITLINNYYIFTSCNLSTVFKAVILKSWLSSLMNVKNTGRIYSFVLALPIFWAIFKNEEAKLAIIKLLITKEFTFYK